MYRARHRVTGEVRTGAWAELCHLDKRVWDITYKHVLSHNPRLHALALIVTSEPNSMGFPGRTYMIMVDGDLCDKPEWY